MTTKFFAAFVAAMFSLTMSAADIVSNNTSSQPDNDLPGVTVLGKRKVEIFNTDHTMKFEFNLDAAGRVETKVNYIGSDDKWSPVSAYSVFYGEKETVLTYAEYNVLTKTFTRNPKQVRYNATEYPEIIRVPQTK